MESIQNILPPIVDERTKVLILGSMPGKQSLEKQQYYGNRRNHFWPVMGKLLATEIPEDYIERIALLRKHRIGLWDSIESCEREGSLDSTIKNEVPNNFSELFKKYPQIQLILFNGGKSYDVFKRHVGFDVLEGRAYKKMPSTSPIPGRNIKTFEEKVIIWSIVLDYLS